MTAGTVSNQNQTNGAFVEQANGYQALMVVLGDTTPSGGNGVINVAGQAITPTHLELIRPSDTTAYAVGDAIGTNIAISGATNATPIVVTSATHNLADGDPVTIASVGGNTTANGNVYAKVTGYSATTFALYSDDTLTTAVAGNGAYTSGGTIARCLRFRNAMRLVGGSAFITKLLAFCDSAANVAQIRMHFYRSQPTAPLDNLAWNPLYTEFSAYVGWIDLPALYAGATPQSGAAAIAEFLGQLELIGVTKDVYGIPQTLTALTPVSGSKFSFKPTFDVN